MCHQILLSMMLGYSSVVMKTLHCKSVPVTFTMLVVADGSMLPPYTVLNCKTVPKEHLLRRMIFRCRHEGWVTSEFVKILLTLIWDRRPRGCF